MKTYKVYTQWIGYSEILVEAESPTHAHELVEDCDYDTKRERITGNGLTYGFEDETVIKIEEVEDERT